MIDIFEALGWLNAIDNLSYLNYEAFQMIAEARRFSLPDRQVSQIVRSLRILGQSATDPREKGETLLHCASIDYMRNWFPQAVRDALEAVLSYEEDDYRRAVAFWIIGAAQWEMLQNYAAYDNWNKARKLFQKQVVYFQQSAVEMEQQRNRIWRMNTKLAARPEEIATWLNCFEDSSLYPPSMQVIEQVRKKLFRPDCTNIYALMQDFQEANQRSRSTYERAEICLEFGLAMYQLGNLYFAIDLLRRAVQSFYSGIGTYHKQAVARCMLGAMEWMIQAPHNQAIEDWTQCIEELEKLRTVANQNNDFTRRDWYTKHRHILYDALFEKISPLPPSLRTTQKSKSPPPVTKSHMPHRHQYLVILLHGDVEQANRLVEFERKQFPDDDLDKLIERAIERLLRDRK